MVSLERLNQLGFRCHNCRYYDPNVDVDDNAFEDYYKDDLCICACGYAFPCQYLRLDAKVETLAAIHPPLA